FASTATNQYPGAIGLAGGIGILGFAGLQIASVVSKRNVLAAPVMASDKSPFVAGIALSALNPFFLLWWFTVGIKLIADSATFGFDAGLARSENSGTAYKSRLQAFSQFIFLKMRKKDVDQFVVELQTGKHDPYDFLLDFLTFLRTTRTDKNKLSANVINAIIRTTKK